MDAFQGRFLTEIVQELERLPTGMLDEVLEAKSYRYAKELVDAADTDEARKRLPKTPLFLLVDEIDGELAEEEIAARIKREGMTPG